MRNGIQPFGIFPKILSLGLILELLCGHLLFLQVGNKCHENKDILVTFCMSSATLRQELME